MTIPPRNASNGWSRSVVGFALVFSFRVTLGQVDPTELKNPPICSADTANEPALNGICTVRPLEGDQHEIKINLVAKTSTVDVGGYKVETEHYNRAYVSPIVRAIPGDTVAAHLENLLKARPTNNHPSMLRQSGDENPTNLHYFHGGIVTPNNSRPPVDAGSGNGDNIYVRLSNATKAHGMASVFEFNVPIPGELDARVLEGGGNIPHPLGLDWYHSHMHGISSDQVMGGLSGLLSVGEDKANVLAKCLASYAQCKKDTDALRDTTDVRYVLLRDLPLKMIGALPEEASGAKAIWDPEARDFPVSDTDKCEVWKKGAANSDPDPKLREGFCQRTRDSAWLFTLNGQRFPTITVKRGRNLLLRLGNLSSNVAYWLDLTGEGGSPDAPKLTILSLDGVVPAAPSDSSLSPTPIDAFDVPDLLLMPATRAEIYIRNDNRLSHGKQTYILRTKGIDAGTDHWPEIQLAKIVLEPSEATSKVKLALNAPSETPRITIFEAPIPQAEVTLPNGCVRDLDPSKGEYRQVTFNEEDATLPTNPHKVEWSITTDIFHPPGNTGTFDLKQFLSSDAPGDPTKIWHKAFEDYELPDGSLDWAGQQINHVCIHLDHAGSHKQLWVLSNPTSALHNFHIHQMKFRLATPKDFAEHRMNVPPKSHTCLSKPCAEPDYKFYETGNALKSLEWHDTIPVPPSGTVFIVMSFDAPQQLGRFVFHCHILKHEDKGLMAPIEVWGSDAPFASVKR